MPPLPFTCSCLGADKRAARKQLSTAFCANLARIAICPKTDTGSVMQQPMVLAMTDHGKVGTTMCSAVAVDLSSSLKRHAVEPVPCRQQTKS